jgi:hypothetical protein
MATPPAAAYEKALPSEAVREAYFLGQRRDQEMSAFLSRYTRQLLLPDKGPYVSRISLHTPYAEVILASWRHAAGYSAQQAEQDYRDRGDTIRVRVSIEFTPTFNAVEGIKPHQDATGNEAGVRRLEDFWRTFRYELRQGDALIAYRSIGGTPIYGHNGITGAEVTLEYDAGDVASAETTFEVFTVDDHHAVAQFDLSKLR